MTDHLDFPANLESPLGNALYLIRLRHEVPRWVSGHWQQVSVKQRAASQRFEIDRAKPQPWHPKRWQPPEGRESPRERLMGHRRAMLHYAFAGWMRFHQRNRDHYAATPWWHVGPHIERRKQARAAYEAATAEAIRARHL